MDGRVYPWGNDFQCRNGNFDDETRQDGYVVVGGPNCDGYDDTAPVGNYESGKSPYGIYDMAGNVWEWVSDWYSGIYYQSSPFENPFGPSSGKYRVLRGGSWFNLDNVVRSAFRYNAVPRGHGFSYSVGFRCARSLP
jgi:formylglycine-generating enzyme required for sulfatase activity